MKTLSIATLKSTLIKISAMGILAGAILVAAPAKADAQGFSVHVGFGRPVYGPVYGPGFYAERRREEIRREEFLRHERWERDNHFHGYYR